MFAHSLPTNQFQWQRLTFSKLTTAYFVFSVIHCIIQASLQIRAFTINRDAANFLSSISVQANATDNRIPVISNGNLSLCSQVPTHLNDYAGCQVIWNGTAKSNVVADPNVSSYSSVQPTTFAPTPTSSATSSSELPTTSALPAINAQAQAAPVVVTQTITPTITIIVAPTNAIGSNDDDDGDIDDLDLHVHRRFSPKALVFDEDGVTEVTIPGDNVNATLTQSCVWSLNWPVAMYVLFPWIH